MTKKNLWRIQNETVLRREEMIKEEDPKTQSRALIFFSPTIMPVNNTPDKMDFLLFRSQWAVNRAHTWHTSLGKPL